MHVYGGVYSDLDTWCLRPMSNLTAAVPRSGAMVAMMGYEEAFHHNVPVRGITFASAAQVSASVYIFN